MLLLSLLLLSCSFFFFFNDTATTEIYTLSLHDALPIWTTSCAPFSSRASAPTRSSSTAGSVRRSTTSDRKSTRLNSSHSQISYAVFCLKKKKKKYRLNTQKQEETYDTNNSRHWQVTGDE